MGSSKNIIVCARHGETVWKTEGRTHGQLDSSLSEKGKGQVRELALQLRAETFGLILSSSLGRARQSAEILAHELDIREMRTTDYLVEQGEGAFEGLTRTEQQRLFPQCFDGEGHVIADSIPGSERIVEFRNRILEGLREIQACAESIDVLVVTHSGVMQVIFDLISGERQPNTPSFRIM